MFHVMTRNYWCLAISLVEMSCFKVMSNMGFIKKN